MTGRLLRRFLADRAGLLAASAAALGLMLLFFGLVLAGVGRGIWSVARDVAYALLLGVTVLLLHLSFSFAGWYRAAAHIERLIEGRSLEALVNLPPGYTREQARYREVLEGLYRLHLSELAAYRAAHEQHLTFINLWVHQMKTPISTLRVIAERAANEGEAYWRGTLAEWETETGKMADGLDLVLSAARLQDFHLDHRIERVELTHALRRVINGRKEQFIRLRIFPEIVAAEGDWTVLTDDKWTRFCLEQVIVNALKYGSQAGRTGQRLRCELSRSATGMQLRISDQGPGIPPEDLPRVFEPFFTGMNGRRFAGATGMGLYLVRMVMERLGHEVAIESAVGQGATVILRYRA